MTAAEVILTILGLSLFETVSSIDNAIINAEVLSGMREKSRRWFLTWGILFAVFVPRGILPWLIVWIALPQLGPAGALTATFSSDAAVIEAVEASSPSLLMGGGVFLLLLFLHWLFLEPKAFGLIGERFFSERGVWFFAAASVFLTVVVWFALRSPGIAFAAVVGSTAFFITHGFKENAAEQEKRLLGSGLSDVSKLLYLEILDLTFSIDGVFGAFAFTLSVPLILVGNGLGALIVRQITIGNIERVKRYRYLKNGAMYSILCLGAVMIADGFGAHVPHWLSPLVTFGSIGFFFARSVIEVRKQDAARA
jgi:hypothetical protein